MLQATAQMESWREQQNQNRSMESMVPRIVSLNHKTIHFRAASLPRAAVCGRKPCTSFSLVPSMPKIGKGLHTKPWT